MDKSDITAARIFRYHWHQAMQFRRHAITSLILAPFTLLIDRYVTPLIIAALLAAMQAGTITLASTGWMIVVYGVLQIITHVIGYRVSYRALWSVQVLGAREIYRKSYEKLTAHSLNFYSDTFTGSLVASVNKLVSAYMNFWSILVYKVLSIATVILATIIGIGFMIWQYALVLLALVIIFIVATYFGTRHIQHIERTKSRTWTDIAAQLSDSFTNMLAIKTDGREQHEKSRLDASVDSMIDQEFLLRNSTIRLASTYSVINTLINVSAFVASIWAVEHGLANAAVVYLCLTYTFNLIGEVWNVSDLFREVYRYSGDSSELLGYMDAPVEVPDTSSKKLTPSAGAIHIESLTFRYSDSQAPLFHQLTLDIKPGEKVGIVGPSGGGKTTLTKLLMRFIDPQSGRVIIDGQDIRAVSQASLHRSIAYVPQEPLLFHRSLRENISYSKPRATTAEIKKAAREAYALDFIKELPDGFNATVGERGVKLSGGQRQRVAIARAILKDAPILILDEATSSLDSESEQLVQKSFDALMAGRTTIVIAHRLSTIAKLDRIIVLDKGRIVEDGTHTELLKNNKTYARLWAHQSGGFIEE